MTQTQKLDPQTRAQALSNLPGWTDTQGRDAITKTFYFKNFNSAFGFMTRVAMVAEKLDHHPEWSNVYAKVEVVLTTHTANGVTDLDIKLAQSMEQLALTAGLKL